jgi:hypothetical protein
MPNHFHFLLWMNEESVKLKKQGGLQIQHITNAYRTLLSSFSAIQAKKYNISGSWFRQRTKYVIVESESHSSSVFHYIHQNPLRAKLVTKMADWEFSSFRDYAEIRTGSLCNKELTLKLIEYNPGQFLEESNRMVPDWVFQKAFKKASENI